MEVSYHVPDFSVLDGADNVFEYIAGFLSLIVESVLSVIEGGLKVLGVVARMVTTFDYLGNFFSPQAWGFIGVMFGAIVSICVWKIISMMKF